MSPRFFTLDEANALVPKVAELMDRVLQLHAHLRTMCRALLRDGVGVTPEALAGGAGPVADARMSQRLQQARGVYEVIREGIDEIEALGAEVKDVESGLVDFHSWLGGNRDVLLCWRMGEAKIAWYHDPDTGVAGRQSVDGLEFANRLRC